MTIDVMTPREIADSIADGSTLAITGSGGGLLDADEIFAAIEARFLETGRPNGLTLVHSLGLGDRDRRGTNRFAHEGMVRRVIGGHWTWSRPMQKLAAENRIEAYSLPSGVISLLLRESGSGRPGLITRTGLGTFVDPRHGGGRVNAKAQEELVETIEIGEETFLRFKPIKVDVGILKATYGDVYGNLSTADEPADLDCYAVALAAHNTGGRVYAQVRDAVMPGALKPRDVAVPGVLVDGIAVVRDQFQTYRGGYDSSLSGRMRTTAIPEQTDAASGPKRVLALRAAQELFPGACVNFGFGASAGVAEIISERGEVERYWTTIEQGIHGGAMLTGALFGMAVNPSVILPACEQFDFYHGGGLDIAFLGLAELDEQGNVNVSHMGGQIVGPGGFIDITQNAGKVVFCGTLEAKGSDLEVGNGRLTVRRHGEIRKLVPQVSAITFSGKEAVRRGQEVVYVTERAVFRLTPAGVELTEIAPGIDMQADVVDRMAFTPIIRDVRTMDETFFRQ